MKRKTILKEAGVFLVVALLLLAATAVTANTKNLIMSMRMDTTPPVTTCTFNGTINGEFYFDPVIATLSATDNESGVNYTKYKLDDGPWMTYTVPFVISITKAFTDPHTVYYYSVDMVGNIEATRNKSLILKIPIEFNIKRGFSIGGFVITAKNNGSITLTDIHWGVDFEKVFNLGNTTQNGTIASLAPGESITLKVLGSVLFNLKGPGTHTNGWWKDFKAWFKEDSHGYAVGFFVGVIFGIGLFCLVGWAVTEVFIGVAALL